jgi:hypothetical protein
MAGILLEGKHALLKRHARKHADFIFQVILRGEKGHLIRLFIFFDVTLRSLLLYRYTIYPVDSNISSHYYNTAI